MKKKTGPVKKKAKPATKAPKSRADVAAVAKTFRARLEPDGTNLRWTVIRVPMDVKSVWGTRGLLKVKIELNGHAFRTSLFPTKTGTHLLMVNKKMQSAARIGPGSMAEVRIQPDTTPRSVTVSIELERAINQVPALRRWFEKLSYSVRKWFNDLVAQGKQPETRQRRAQQMAELLMSAMEAERELPPLIKSAFARNPVAAEGWKRMTARQRRQELLAIFYYRSPEAQQRRLMKTVEMAAKAGKKNRSKTSDSA
jgi:uncharacterized protein YdeI (YjbR/CyaY-like superfamily)